MKKIVLGSIAILLSASAASAGVSDIFVPLPTVRTKRTKTEVLAKFDFHVYNRKTWGVELRDEDRGIRGLSSKGSECPLVISVGVAGDTFAGQPVIDVRVTDDIRVSKEKRMDRWEKTAFDENEMAWMTPPKLTPTKKVGLYWLWVNVRVKDAHADFGNVPGTPIRLWTSRGDGWFSRAISVRLDEALPEELRSAEGYVLGMDRIKAPGDSYIPVIRKRTAVVDDMGNPIDTNNDDLPKLDDTEAPRGVEIRLHGFTEKVKIVWFDAQWNSCADVAYVAECGDYDKGWRQEKVLMAPKAARAVKVYIGDEVYFDRYSLEPNKKTIIFIKSGGSK